MADIPKTTLIAPSGRPIVVQNLAGMTFNDLTAKSYSFKPGSTGVWLCVCKCGLERSVSRFKLVTGHTKSCHKCGLEKSIMAMRENNPQPKINLPHYAKIYVRWQKINQRCHRPDLVPDWVWRCYGGRGIAVCDEWRGDKMKFYQWAASSGFSPELEIDRIDNNKGYEPSNCRWATRAVQAANKRNNRYIEFNGEKLTLTEAGRRSGLSDNILRYRMKMGWPESCLFMPKKVNNHAEPQLAQP